MRELDTTISKSNCVLERKIKNIYIQESFQAGLQPNAAGAVMDTTWKTNVIPFSLWTSMSRRNWRKEHVAFVQP